MDPQQPGLVAQIVPFLLIAAIFYFLLIRPQNKQMKETKQMLASLKTGDKIMTRGGMFGIIASLREDEVDLEVSKGVKITFARSAVASVIKTN